MASMFTQIRGGLTEFKISGRIKRTGNEEFKKGFCGILGRDYTTDRMNKCSSPIVITTDYLERWYPEGSIVNLLS